MTDRCSVPGSVPTAGLRVALAVACLVACTGSTAPPPAADSSLGDPTPAVAGDTQEPVPGGAPGTAGQPAAPEQADYDRPRVVGSFDLGLVPEASGLAASLRSPGVLYLLNDARGTSELLAVRSHGASVRRVEIAGFQGRNPEALAVGPCGVGGPGSCVYLGDIGDNSARRDEIRVLRIPEPDLGAGGSTAAQQAAVARLRYPTGSVDAEALLVDAGGRPAIVTKVAGDDDRGGARLYTADSFADGVLVDAGAVPVPTPSRPWAAAVVGNVVTAADSRPGRVLLRTYDAAFEYLASDSGAPLATFASWPVREVPTAPEPQGEAIAYAADGCGFYTVSEQVGEISYTACRRSG